MVSLALVACFGLALLWAPLAHACGSEAHHGDATHAEDGQCPDRGSDGSPCGPDCTCTCCPGHWTAAPRDLASPMPAPGAVRTRLVPSHPAEPTGTTTSVFRPPRA